MKDLILNIISILIALVGVFLSFRSLIRLLRAEKELAVKLKIKAQQLSTLLQNEGYASSKVNKIHIDESKLNELLTIVKQSVDELPKNKKKDILEGLDQKSSRGRLSYLNRLLHISGFNTNISVNG
jgi:hypothetical protein